MEVFGLIVTIILTVIVLITTIGGPFIIGKYKTNVRHTAGEYVANLIFNVLILVALWIAYIV